MAPLSGLVGLVEVSRRGLGNGRKPPNDLKRPEGLFGVVWGKEMNI